MLKSLALAGALALALASLAGCSSTNQNALSADIATFNAQVANSLPAACALLAAADASFHMIAAAGKIPGADVSAESAAMAGVNAICANPTGLNAATALQTLASAYVAVVAAGKSD
ncbi:MAG: hypothetical protein JO234_08050 [Hyphomicrobiales bacterium]|nr:hypothetical protein [Hyphomicrobiales bacterium]